MDPFDLMMVPREEWGALEGLPDGDLLLPAPNVFVAFTYTQMCPDKDRCIKMVKHLQERHKRQGRRSDIKYNFLIGGDGRVYEGRGWKLVPHLPPKVKQFNRNSLFIAHIGSFKEFGLPIYMKVAQANLIRYGQENGYIDKEIYYKFLTYEENTVVLPKKRAF